MQQNDVPVVKVVHLENGSHAPPATVHSAASRIQTAEPMVTARSISTEPVWAYGAFLSGPAFRKAATKRCVSA
jgi:hypothetical protein